MKNGVVVPFPLLPSFRKALLDGIDDEKADYSPNGVIRFNSPGELETELLDRCGSCYREIKRIFKVMRLCGDSVPAKDLVELIEAKQEHLRKRAGFEGLLLSKCGFENGNEYGNLGREYMGRCYGSTNFHCCQEIAVGYVKQINELIQIETKS